MDVFQFVATLDGRLTVRQQAASDSGLDSILTAYAADQQELAFNDDSGGTRDSTVTFLVAAGQTYYLQAAAFESSTGEYLLTLLVEQDLPDVQPLTLDELGGTIRSRNLWRAE